MSSPVSSLSPTAPLPNPVELNSNTLVNAVSLLHLIHNPLVEDKISEEGLKKIYAQAKAIVDRSEHETSISKLFNLYYPSDGLLKDEQVEVALELSRIFHTFVPKVENGEISRFNFLGYEGIDISLKHLCETIREVFKASLSKYQKVRNGTIAAHFFTLDKYSSEPIRFFAFIQKRNITLYRIDSILSRTNFHLILKMYDISTLHFHTFKISLEKDNEEQNKLIRHEVKVMLQASKIESFKAFQIPLHIYSMETRSLYITPFYFQGNLENWLNTNNPTLHRRIQICAQLATTILSPMQVYGFRWLNAKPANLLIESFGNNLHFYPYDYSSASFDTEEDSFHHEWLTSHYHSLGDIINLNEAIQKRDKKAFHETAQRLDLFSFGVIFYRILAGNAFPYELTVPYGNGNYPHPYAQMDEKALENVHCPKSLINLIKGMVQLDPNKRISLNKILQGWNRASHLKALPNSDKENQGLNEALSSKRKSSVSPIKLRKRQKDDNGKAIPQKNNILKPSN